MSRPDTPEQKVRSQWCNKQGFNATRILGNNRITLGFKWGCYRCRESWSYQSPSTDDYVTDDELEVLQAHIDSGVHTLLDLANE